MRRWSVRFVASLVLFAGCNQVFGIDETGSLPDAAVHTVTGQIRHLYAVNDVQGRPLVESGSLDEAHDVFVSVRGDDGREIDIAVAADGSFALTRSAPDALYRLNVSIDGFVYELQHDAPSLEYVVRSVGRLDAQPVIDPTPITFPATSTTVGGAVASTGVWAVAQSFASPRQVDWQFVPRSSTRHGLLSASARDRLHYYELGVTMSAEGVYHLSTVTAGSAAIEMTSGTPVMLPAPSPVVPEPCATLVGAHPADRQRFVGALSRYSHPSAQWIVYSVPARELGLVGEMEVAVGQLNETDELAVTPLIHNPVPGSSLLAASAITLERDVPLRHPAASAPELDPRSVGLFHAAPVTCSTPSQPISIVHLGTGIPTHVTLGGVALDDDTRTVPVGTTDDVELTWNVDGAPHDMYNVTLFEVANEPFFDFTYIVPIRTFQTVTPRALIDASLLVRGRYFYVEVGGLTGTPKARDGNFSELAYPYSAVTVHSSMFKVVR